MKQFFFSLLLLAACLGLRAQEIVYMNASELPLYGKAIEETSGLYQRFPAAYEQVSRKPLWDLSLNSAGLYVRFRTDAPAVHARWTNGGNHMPHMTDAGTGGLDLYALIDGKWHFVGSGFDWNGAGRKEHERKLVGNMDPKMREYMLYLPLYDRLDVLEIGVPEGYSVFPPMADTPKADKPIVMYGTSILQGGCASRAGMAHTAILSRAVDREVINLGFSGNAQLDWEVAELIAKVKSPAVIVLDYVPNSLPQQIRERGEAFYYIVRKAHPTVPVIFVEDPIFTHAVVDNNIAKEVSDKNVAQAELYLKLRHAGEKNIYYVGAQGMLGNDGDACVDGIHLTDLGMMRYAEHMLPTLRKALRKAGL